MVQRYRLTEFDQQISVQKSMKIPQKLFDLTMCQTSVSVEQRESWGLAYAYIAFL